MQTTANIPAKTDTRKVVEFRLRPQSRDVRVILQDTETGDQDSVNISIDSLITGATSTQKTTLKVFFKRIAAAALDAFWGEDSSIAVTEADVSGELFDDA